jgi:predicted house-cleaning noncanonical NTP pyrophosphatase (MazG superfamily)
VDSECDFSLDPDFSALGRRLRSVLREAVEQLGAPSTSLLIVRSSGTAETLSRRGSHESVTCRPDQLVATLRELRGRVVSGPSQKIHWAVQTKVDVREQGHLSNERRLREESRDWIVEFEQPRADNLRAHLEHLSVRQWRDGTFSQIDRLPCRYRADLPSALKQVAQWGMQFSSRLHFEWVWDGSYLYVVQVDVEESSTGVDPSTLVPEVAEPLQCSSLNHFRRASPEDYASFKKLKNAALYGQLGYVMPPFYVLDDQSVLHSVLDGQLPPTLAEDLSSLTVQPLIARVDGRNVLPEKREMLPRSDELRSEEAAGRWLIGDFATQVRTSGLENSELCLIVHHFIPAVASAWARAEPSGRWVRIESLWGVPEGLYWYSHDTFEVDTVAVDAASVGTVNSQNFVIRERRRFKGIFVAPDLTGEWITHNTKPPFDWRRSIAKDSWLREIAATTRKIAVEEQSPVSVMWLVDVRQSGSAHPVLPWFHSNSEYPEKIRAAPVRKISSHWDFTVRDAADWQRLRDLPKDKRIDRVKVEPMDAHLIRNTAFANSIVELSRDHGFVVELAGGLLSHIYYVLTREGCNVECIDLYGADEETLVFNKIVRDQIPGQIQRGGERAEVVQLQGRALELALKRKLIEEALEVLDTVDVDDARGELADVIEVVWAIARSLGIGVNEIESERARKNKKRGTFNDGLMLIKTSTPHSLSPAENLHLEQESAQPPGNAELSSGTLESLIASGTRLPVKPDLRTLSGGQEKLVSFSVEIPSLESVRGATTFSLPTLRDAQGSEVTLEIELRRSKNDIKGAIRIRTAPSQFTFDFDDGEKA